MSKPVFAPMLVIKSGTFNIDFYLHALGVVELRRFSNDDGSIHVLELSIDGTMFHLHEEGKGPLSPLYAENITTSIGLFVDDPDALMEKALAHGAILYSPMQDYDYGYRQGQFIDPFGHRWQLQKKIV